MTFAVVLINIVLLGAFVFLIALLISKLFTLKQHNIVNKIILGVFVAAVISSIAANYLIPETYFEKRVHTIQYTDKDNTKAMEDMNKAVAQRQYDSFDEIKGIHKYRNWSFTLNTNEIGFLPAEGISPLPVCVIERKKINDGRLDITLYSTPAAFYGADLSELIIPYHVYMLGNQVKISDPLKVVLNMNTFKKDFYVSQFQGKEGSNYWYAPYFRDYALLHIRVPKDLKIKAGDANYQVIQ